MNGCINEKFWFGDVLNMCTKSTSIRMSETLCIIHPDVEALALCYANDGDDGGNRNSNSGI